MKDDLTYLLSVQLSKTNDGRWMADARVTAGLQKTATVTLSFGVTPQAAVQRAMFSLGLYKRISEA